MVDPDGREILLSVGAALFNLRIAMLACGRLPRIRLLAGMDHTDLAASVDIGRPIRASDTVRMLNRAIPRRRTNRRPFSEARVPPDTLAECARACAAEGAHLTFLDAGTTEAVLSLVRTAERSAHTEPSYWAELAAWTGHSSNRRDGVPPEAYGPWSARNAVPIRDFGIIEPARRRRVEMFESEPTVAVVHSRDDSPRGWLEAGQALELTLLTATVRGVATTLMTQPLEVPCLRLQIARAAEGLVPQAIVRFGYGPPSPATPRRPLEEVVEAL